MKVAVMGFDLNFQLFCSNAFIKNLTSLQFTIASSTLTILAIIYFAVFHLLMYLNLTFKKKL